MIMRKLSLRSKQGILKEIIIVGDTPENTLKYMLLLDFNYRALGYRDYNSEQTTFTSNNSKHILSIAVTYITYFRQFSDLSYLVYFVADDYRLVGQYEAEFSLTMQMLGFNILDNDNEEIN